MEGTTQPMIIIEITKPKRAKKPSLAAFLRALAPDERDRFCVARLKTLAEVECAAQTWQPQNAKEHRQCARLLLRAARERKTLLRHLQPEALHAYLDARAQAGKDNGGNV